MSDPSLPPVVVKPLGADGPIEDLTPTEPAPEEASGIGSSRPLVFGILFGVTGALGLPLLWGSPAFSRKEKWVWSIINCLYTLGLIGIAILSLRVIFDAMQQL